MTPPSDQNNGDDDETEFGAPVPPQKQPPDQPAPVQQPPYAQTEDPGSEGSSGWTQFGAPLPGPEGTKAPAISQPPIAQPPINTPPINTPPISQPPIGSPFSTPAMAPPATPSGVPGPGEPGWVPGTPPPEPVEPASNPVGPPGPGEPGWVPGSGDAGTPAADAPPGPGEPGWVPGGAAEPEISTPPAAGVPGPGEPGWVPGGAAEPDVSMPPAAGVPGPGEPGWVPGGGDAEVSVPPVAEVSSSHSAPVDDERTQIATPLPSATDDADRTMIAASIPDAGGAEQTQTADPDKTMAAAPAAAVNPDATLIEPATGAAAGAAAAKPQSSARRPRKGDGPTLDIGTVINNNYRIDQVLKAGGMGEVYRGAEVGTGDPVAIKVILPELAEDEKVGQMFKREARTLRQLQDEAIVRYYNYVHDPDLDAYCLVMSFISGVPLSDHTAKHGPISVDDGKILLRRLAKGLQKAHDLDVVHRDLSPDNVMLPEEVVAEAVIIDFGIAKSNVEKEQTLAGQFAGKFRYVSPEQLGHFGGDIGPQSDIYSLALLMAAALIGTPLEMGASIVDAVQSRQSIPDLEGVPPDLRPILMHMLEPNPEHRPKTMEDIIRLMDFPEQIPLNYRQGLPLPNTAQPNTTMNTGLPYRPPTNQVSGLQLAPTTNTTGATNAPSELPKRKRTAGGMGIAMVLALAVLGGGGYYGYSEGWFDAPEPPAPDPVEVAEAPVRLENTREGFLGTFNSGGCTYATTRISTGGPDGAIAGMSSVPGAFGGLPSAFAGQFGATPTIIDQQVAEAQCAALTLAKGLQGTSMEPIAIELSPVLTEQGVTVDGTLNDPDERNLWLVLVGANGQIFNLTNRLSDPIGSERTFRFNLSPLRPGTPGAPQLVLAIATEEPLVRASVARDGTPAADLLPLIQREIDGMNGRAVSALGYVLQEPFTPPPPPEPEDGEEGGAIEGDAASE